MNLLVLYIHKAQPDINKLYPPAKICNYTVYVFNNCETKPILKLYQISRFVLHEITWNLMLITVFASFAIWNEHRRTRWENVILKIGSAYKVEMIRICVNVLAKLCSELQNYYWFFDCNLSSNINIIVVVHFRTMLIPPFQNWRKSNCIEIAFSLNTF